VITRRRPEVDLHLVDGKEIITYADYAELLEKVTYYLNHSTVLQRIAMAGYHKVVVKHNIQNRVDTLLNFLTDL